MAVLNLRSKIDLAREEILWRRADETRKPSGVRIPFPAPMEILVGFSLLDVRLADSFRL